MTGTTESSQAALHQRGQGETVLVVEDDHRVRRATCIRLVDLGYCVLEASDGKAALEVLSQHPETRVLFSDLAMPGGMSGLELINRVHELYPSVHIILTSGYSAELLDGEEEHLGFRVLRKPYHRVDLARVFREALQAR
jgi:CheY-like chemotaxis protein